MAKPGRNDPCHCGSGNKYKKCCLAKDEAAERDSLVKAQARRDQPAVAHRHERAAAHRLPVNELMAEVAARLRMAEEEDAYEDELDAASNAVAQLVGAAKLDEAEAAARDLVKAQARRDQPAVAHRHECAAAHRLPVNELMAEIAARLRMAEEEDAYEDELDAASNAVVQLVGAAKLDEAEAAARDLLVRFPDVHDGWDRLGMVHEARGDSRQAADCYRKVIDFISQHPDDYDAGMVEQFAKLVERLDPPVAT